MKFKLIWLIVWFFIYVFINEPLKQLIVSGEMKDLFYWTKSQKGFLYLLSGNISMFLYCIEKIQVESTNV